MAHDSPEPQKEARMLSVPIALVDLNNIQSTDDKPLAIFKGDSNVLPLPDMFDEAGNARRRDVDPCPEHSHKVRRQKSLPITPSRRPQAEYSFGRLRAIDYEPLVTSKE